jgi:hypothetical protein
MNRAIGKNKKKGLRYRNGKLEMQMAFGVWSRKRIAMSSEFRHNIAKPKLMTNKIFI